MSIELQDLSSSGIEFHSLGAATANALSPNVFSLAFGVAAKSTWCKGQLVYIQNCVGKTPIVKKMVINYLI